MDYALVIMFGQGHLCVLGLILCMPSYIRYTNVCFYRENCGGSVVKAIDLGEKGTWLVSTQSPPAVSTSLINKDKPI